VARQANPGKCIAAVAHDALADVLEQGVIVVRPYQGLVAARNQPQRPVQSLQFDDLIRNFSLQPTDLLTLGTLHVPFFDQRYCHLLHFQRLKRLTQHKPAIRLAELLYDLVPAIVAVGAAKDHLYVRINPPQRLDRCQAIPAAWHAHVDEGNGELACVGQQSFGPAAGGFAILQQFQFVTDQTGRRAITSAKELLLQRVEPGTRSIVFATEHLAEGRQYRVIVVDD